MICIWSQINTDILFICSFWWWTSQNLQTMLKPEVKPYLPEKAKHWPAKGTCQNKITVSRQNKRNKYQSNSRVIWMVYFCRFWWYSMILWVDRWWGRAQWCKCCNWYKIVCCWLGQKQENKNSEQGHKINDLQFIWGQHQANVSALEGQWFRAS